MQPVGTNWFKKYYGLKRREQQKTEMILLYEKIHTHTHTFTRSYDMTNKDKN